MNNEETRRKIYEEIEDILEKKNHDYGDSAQKSYDIFGPIAIVIRMSDKMNRAINLCKGADSKVKEEPLRETLMDLLGYNLMLLAMMEDEDSTSETVHLAKNPIEWVSFVDQFLATLESNDAIKGRIIFYKRPDGEWVYRPEP